MEWYQFYSEEPFGPGRDNLHAGMVCAVLSNVHRNKKKKRDPYQPADFMIRPAEEVRENRLSKSIAWLLAVAKPKAK